LDFVLTGSQKALALPPGLAFGVAQENVLRRAQSRPGRGVYLDLLEFESSLGKYQTPNTPAISLLYALAAQAERIREETVEGRWARHVAMARRTYDWVEAMRARGLAMEVLAPPGYRSPTVTCIRLPPGWTGPHVTAALRERGYTIAPGYGRMKDALIRIGHMGDHTVSELEGLLAELEEVLA
ncbi:MAG: alanine--glyoxylate aminotransferase family protein, partial [Gemmatimonadetes bacterium]|nr:alanine--glyoxylate aminotransferase family protein [Gemmatimonadota bacterium]